MKLCFIELFEIELFIFFKKSELALNNLQLLIYHKTQTTNKLFMVLDLKAIRFIFKKLD